MHHPLQGRALSYHLLQSWYTWFLLFQEVLISHVYTKASKHVVLKMLSIFFQLLVIFCQEAQAFGVSAGHLCWQVRSAG